MKLKNIFLAMGGALMLCGSFASCSDDKTYDFDGIDYQRVYFNNATSLTEGAIVKTPVGNFASLDAAKTIKTTAKTTQAIQVNVAIDNSLVAEYNTAHNTDYLSAPDGVFSLSASSLTINADTTGSREELKLAVSEAGISQLEAGKSYLVPVAIQSSSDSNFRPSSNVGSAYYLVSVTEKLINEDGDLSTLTAIADKTGWSASCNDSGVSDLQNIVDGNNSSCASFQKGTDVEVVVDLGKDTSFSGIEVYFYRYYYAFNDITFEYSTDGTTWSGIGTIENSWTPSLSCVLYGPVTARYVRFSGSFMYGAYSWASYYLKIYEFNLYN